MSSRIEKLATSYKESKPEIRTSNVIRRVQLESALAEEEAAVDVERFGRNLELLTSVVPFTNELRTQARLAKRAGTDFGILDILVGDREALAAAKQGAALEEEGLVMKDGIKVEEHATYEDDLFDIKKKVSGFRQKVRETHEKMLEKGQEGTGVMGQLLQFASSTDEELGSEYTDEEIEGFALPKRNFMQNLFGILRGKYPS